MRQPTVGISQTPIRIAPLIGVFLDIITKYCIIDINLFGGYMKSFYKLFEKGFLKYLNEKNGQGFTKDNLLLAFHDLDGNAYYTFPKEVSLNLLTIVYMIFGT